MVVSMLTVATATTIKWLTVAKIAVAVGPVFTATQHLVDRSKRKNERRR